MQHLLCPFVFLARATLEVGVPIRIGACAITDGFLFSSSSLRCNDHCFISYCSGHRFLIAPTEHLAVIFISTLEIPAQRRELQKGMPLRTASHARPLNSVYVWCSGITLLACFLNSARGAHNVAHFDISTCAKTGGVTEAEQHS